MSEEYTFLYNPKL